MAGILNAGSDFLHSFGDMDVAYNDSKIIEKELADLKKKSSTHQKLVYNIKTCVMGYFCAIVAECIDNGIPIHVYTLDYDHAESIYENTMKFEDDDDKKTDNIIQCIADFPGEKKYYDAIMDRIMQDNPSGFVKFLKFWHIDYMYDNLEKELTVRDSFDSKFDVAFKNNADLLSDITCENYIKIKDFLLKYDTNFYSHGHDNETFANESPYIPAPDISRYKKQLENFFKAFKEKKEWAETYKLALEGTGGRDYKEYFKSLHNNRFFMGYHFYIKDQICWLYGDFNDEDNKPGDSAIAKAMFDSKDTLLFFHDDSVMQFARSGIAMTTAGITELSTKKHIRYKDIRDISLVKDVKKSERFMAIKITDSQGDVISYGSPNCRDEDTEFLEKIIRVYCVVFESNPYVWVKEMGVPEPAETKPDDKPETEKMMVVSDDDLQTINGLVKDFEAKYPKYNLSYNDMLGVTLGIGSNEIVILAHDESNGKGKEGFVFTNAGWYYKPMLNKLITFVPFNELMESPKVHITNADIIWDTKEIGFFSIPLIENADKGDKILIDVKNIINQSFKIVGHIDERPEDFFNELDKRKKFLVKDNNSFDDYVKKAGLDDGYFRHEVTYEKITNYFKTYIDFIQDSDNSKYDASKSSINVDWFCYQEYLLKNKTPDELKNYYRLCKYNSDPKQYITNLKELFNSTITGYLDSCVNTMYGPEESLPRKARSYFMKNNYDLSGCFALFGAKKNFGLTDDSFLFCENPRLIKYTDILDITVTGDSALRFFTNEGSVELNIISGSKSPTTYVTVLNKKLDLPSSRERTEQTAEILKVLCEIKGVSFEKVSSSADEKIKEPINDKEPSVDDDDEETKVFCVECGNEISSKDKFCTYCGAKNEYYGGVTK